MRTQKARDERLTALDGIRGLAVLCIFVHHSLTHQLSTSVRDVGTGFWGGVGAELRLSLICFFVLSGFLLYGTFAKALRDHRQPSLGSYVKRRVARVLPAYWLAMAGSFLLLWGAHMPNLHLPPASDLPLFAFFGQNYSHSTLESLNGPTWTLCIEVAFYVLLPLLGLALWRLRAGPRTQALTLLGLGAFGILWWSADWLGGRGEVWEKALPAYLPYFVVGMLLSLWFVHRDRARTLSGPATIACFAGALALVVGDGFWHLQAGPGHGALVIAADLPAAIGFGLLIVGAVAGTAGRLSRFFTLRPLVGVGVISYGFYLWHLPLMLFGRRLGLDGGFLATMAWALPLTLAVSIASWKLIESPILKWAHREQMPPARKRADGSAPIRPPLQPEPQRQRGDHPAQRPGRPVRPHPVSVSDIT